MERINISSGSPFENVIGFSRALKAGNFIAVSGTASINKDGTTHGTGDPELQARKCMELIDEALKKADASLRDVIRTRILLKQISDWKKVAKVHAEYFKDIKPATTFFEVTNFINPEWLVEIEVDAVVNSN
jgi:enamine deaminase RidA (YjgF/YER057c/UK114 family)